MAGDGAWPLVEGWLAAAGAAARVLPPDPARRGETRAALGVTARSTLGALADETGGIVVEGWLRLLGGAAAGVEANLASWNDLGGGSPPLLCVGFDALGGLFAIDGGGLGVAPGEVCYFAPDTLAWEGVGLGHTDFVGAMLAEPATRADLFDGLRWPGWEADVAPLPFDRVLLAYPPPWTVEGRAANVSRSPVAAREVIRLGFDFARQVGTPAPAPAWAR